MRPARQPGAARLDPANWLDPEGLAAWNDFAREWLGEARKSPRTLQSYGEALAQLAQHIAPVPVLEATRDDLGRYLAWAGDTRGAVTQQVRHRSLRAWYGWADREDLLPAGNPLARIPMAKADQKVVPVLTDQQLAALLKACVGKQHNQLRDRAIILLLCEAGTPRAEEMCEIELGDVDLTVGGECVLVHGKGGKDRLVPLSRVTATAISKYLRARPARAARLARRTDRLWLAEKGPLSERGLQDVVSRRGEQAGVGHVHPHQFRHTSYSRFEEAGGTVNDAMALYGWSADTMTKIYGRHAAARRAVATGRRLGLAGTIGAA